MIFIYWGNMGPNFANLRNYLNDNAIKSKPIQPNWYHRILITLMTMHFCIKSKPIQPKHKMLVVCRKVNNSIAKKKKKTFIVVQNSVHDKIELTPIHFNSWIRKSINQLNLSQQLKYLIVFWIIKANIV